LTVLANLLKKISKSKEKVVIVSHFTKTLDIVSQMCKDNNFLYLRLDGSTNQSKRQTLVDSFNSEFSNEFIFLLSSKSGGTGLNLIGASRIILFDIDWNPATDTQAMSRIWRDGQKNRVVIYRFLTSGTIEEKIYQRQLTKQSLSDTIMDVQESKKQFSSEDLRDIFTLHEDAICNTHDLLDCPCQQNHSSIINSPEDLKKRKSSRETKPNLQIDQLREWYEKQTKN
jgi:DNA repair and recombination protein RAD54B